MEEENVKPFDSFLFIYKTLTVLGFTKLKNPKYAFLGYLYSVYKAISITWSVVYCIQHLAFLAQINNDKDKLIACLLISLPQINVVVKLVTMICYTKRLKTLQELMNSPIFDAISDKDRNLLRKSRDFFNKLMKLLLGTVCITVGGWLVSSLFNRMKDSTYTIAIFVPFRTDTTQGYLWSVFFENFPPTWWIGLGHLTLDCLIVCYYSQTFIQTKIIRYNLEHFTDSEKIPDFYGSKNNRVYKFIDDLDDKVEERFRFIVKRYEKLLWFSKEVDAIFDKPISLQIFTTSGMLCLCVYQLSKGLDVNGVSSTTFYSGYFIIIGSQCFMYCLCGEIVKYETELVGDSVYQSAWYTLSPRFRKQMLIGMTRWTSPITTKAAHVVPLSLTSFFVILRMAFNLFAVLRNTKDKN